MSLPGSLVIGQLRLEHGLRQDETPAIGVFEPRSILRRQDPGILFVLIELLAETDDDQALLAELRDLVRRTYDQESGSLTRRLRAAVTAANQHLRAWNRERTSGRQAAGITCAALDGDELYLAQAGPALAIVAQPGLVDRFPEGSPWHSEEPLQTMPVGMWAALGLWDEVYVDLSYARVGPGYTVLLASAHLPQLLGEGDVVDLLDQEPDEILRDLTILAAGQSLSALVVSVAEPEPEMIAHVPEPEPVPAGPSVATRLTTAARRGAAVAGSAGATILHSAARVMEELLPERGGSAAAGTSERRRQALMWLAIAIPVALALLTAATYLGRRNDRETLFASLLQSAAGRAEQARVLADTDPAQTRELLQAASEELDRALRVRPEDTTARSLRADVQARLETMDGIVRLQDVTSVAALPGAADDRRRLIVQGTSAYVFNQREQVVHRVGLGDRQVAEVLKVGDRRAQRSVGPLVDMAWVPAGGVRSQDAVIVLDSDGTAWQIDALGEVSPLRVAGAEEWRGLSLLGGFAGNLYVLDVSLGQILKYSPTVDGYAIPPAEWLSAEAEVDLGSVVDMAIDGSIYLLMAGGRLEKLVAGRPEPFDQPDEFDLTQPVICFAQPPAGGVFVADAARILQLDAAGTFQRQLLPSEGRWTRLTALWVDELNGWLYAVDANTLVMAPLPQ